MCVVRRRDARGGLTLVEILVATALLVLVTTSAALMFRGISQSWRKGQLKAERYQQARLLFDVFERELSSCVANARYPLLGVAANDLSPLHDGTARFDELMCVTTPPGRAGLVERGYWVDLDGRLMCHDEEPADGDYTTGESERCGADVTAFEVAYVETGSAPEFSAERWDGRAGGVQEGRLPKAIRIRVQIGQQQPELFETVVHVPTS